MVGLCHELENENQQQKKKIFNKCAPGHQLTQFFLSDAMATKTHKSAPFFLANLNNQMKEIKCVSG